MLLLLSATSYTSEVDEGYEVLPVHVWSMADAPPFVRASRTGLEPEACSQVRDGSRGEWCLNAVHFCHLI